MLVLDCETPETTASSLSLASKVPLPDLLEAVRQADQSPALPWQDPSSALPENALAAVDVDIQKVTDFPLQSGRPWRYARMALWIEVVTESLSSQREHVFPPFAKDARFNPSWWYSGSAKSSVSYCRFLDGDEEVARAKILPGSGEYRGYTSWACPVGGGTEIDFIEVRIDLRRSDRRYGRQAVEKIAHRYGHPVVAMSLDETSDGFWRSLGWASHVHPDDDGYGRFRTLFTSV